jgi:SAM-dependent methyltransferase
MSVRTTKAMKAAKREEHEEASGLRASEPSCRFVPSWSNVYDVLYGSEATGSAVAGINAAFLAAQMAYLQQNLPAPPARVLDAGCGTGRHLLALAQSGHRTVGLDASDAMLRRAQQVSGAAGASVDLVCADLRNLPFNGCFDAALCLESPLAYLHQDAALSATLRGLRRSLIADGRLIVDVFDYPATLGEGPFAPAVTRFPTPWGSVTVRETHRYDRTPPVWRMKQEFKVEREGETKTFTVDHALRVRTAAEYAAAVEDAGFAVEELLPAYPGTPMALRDERRILVVAVAGR